MTIKRGMDDVWNEYNGKMIRKTNNNEFHFINR